MDLSAFLSRILDISKVLYIIQSKCQKQIKLKQNIKPLKVNCLKKYKKQTGKKRIIVFSHNGIIGEFLGILSIFKTIKPNSNLPKYKNHTIFYYSIHYIPFILASINYLRYLSF